MGAPAFCYLFVMFEAAHSQTVYKKEILENNSFALEIPKPNQKATSLHVTQVFRQ